MASFKVLIILNDIPVKSETIQASNSKIKHFDICKNKYYLLFINMSAL